MSGVIFWVFHPWRSIVPHQCELAVVADNALIVEMIHSSLSDSRH